MMAVGVLLVPALAFGQTTVPNTAKWIDAIAAMQQAGAALYGRLLGEGVGLASIFTGIMLAWLLVRQALGGDQNLKVDFARLALKVAVVMLMLGSWAPNTAPLLSGWRLPVTVQDIVVRPFDCLQLALLDGSAAPADAAACSALDPKTIARGVPLNSMNGLGKALVQIEDAQDARTQARDKALAKLGILDRIGAYIEEFFSRIFSWLADLGVTAAVVVLMFMFFLVVITGVAMTAVVMTLGPLMVPGLIFPPLQRLWDGWLAATLWVGFFKLVAAIVLTLALSTIGPVEAITTQMVQDALQAAPGHATLAADIAGLVVLLFYLVAGISLMTRVTSFTSHLVK